MLDMGQFIIHNDFPGDFTFVSNYFLDTYMPQANGEFVKIYLWLLRSASVSGTALELSSIADIFNCTENDVLRALKYWKNTGVLDVTFDGRGNLKELRLCSLTGGAKAAPARPNTAPKAKALSPAVPEAAASREKVQPSGQKALSPDKVKELPGREDVIELLFIAEQYLGKTLTPTEINKLLYFYEELHFSKDLMEYLIEYCVSKGSRSIRYIETVALAWAEQKITTVEQAKQETNTYNRNFFAILKAFGIKNRNPVDEEIRYMNLWLNEYAFTLDVISAACSRTVIATGQPNFAYADSILHNWQKKGVRHLSDIDKLDEDRRQQKAAKAENSAARPKPAPSKNKFNNFHQRTYNVDELEKQLLK